MRRILASFCVALLLGGCALTAPDSAYTVKEVLADVSAEHSKLDGRSVAIRGWLGQCGGNSCAIFSTLDDAEKVASYHELPVDEWMPAMDRGLSVGGNDDFDQLALFMQFDQVVIYGEVNATWKKPPDESGNSFGCLDRCDDIKPTSIEKILF